MKKTSKKLSALQVSALAVALTAVSPVSVFAADPANPGGTLNQLIPSWAPKDLFTAIQFILNSVLAIVLLVALVMLIIGGIRYTTSGGSKDAVTAAKNQILYAIIGIVVVVLSFAVISFIYSILPNNSTQ